LATIDGTGSFTCPIVGSSGVIGGPMKASVVGTVGEKFNIVLRLRVCRATLVAVRGVCRYIRWSISSRRQCQNRVLSCVGSQGPNGCVRRVPFAEPVYRVQMVVVQKRQHAGEGRLMHGHCSVEALILLRPLGCSCVRCSKTCGSSSVPVWSVISESVVTCKYIRHAFNRSS